jgi:selenocysteine lyase/cysteine desulfurase
VEALEADPAITHVAVVHCETTTGMLNPIEAIGKIVKSFRKVYIVDAMSSFGGYPIDLEPRHRAGAQAGFAHLARVEHVAIVALPKSIVEVLVGLAFYIGGGIERQPTPDLVGCGHGAGAIGLGYFPKS